MPNPPLPYIRRNPELSIVGDETISRRIIFSAIAALPDLALGALCLVTWVAPGLLGVERVREVVLLMLMEFIVIHSSAFMGPAAWGGFGGKWPRGVAIVGLGLFYSLFVGGFALVFKSWAPLIGFWLLTLNRLSGALLSPADGEDASVVMKGWATSTFFYLIAVFATTFLPIPALGITPEVIDAADVPGDSGLWVTRPYTVVAAGFLYYTACALSELSSHGWMGKVKEMTAPRKTTAG